MMGPPGWGDLEGSGRADDTTLLGMVHVDTSMWGHTTWGHVTPECLSES